MGLKPRAGTPIRLSMGGGGGGWSRSAVVDLRTGHCAVQTMSKDWNIKGSDWEKRTLELTIPEAGLRKLRRTARTILADGDTEYREQFAQQGVSFTARSAAAKATADFHIDVGVGTRHDDAWDLVFGYAEAALASR